MPASKRESPTPPPHIAKELPSAELLRKALQASRFILPSGAALVRAAWNHRSIFPARVDVTHRFGPPAQCQRDGEFPFHWIYAADDAMTAVWEAGLCRNDVTDPGTFYVAAGAHEALLANLSFRMPLALVDLNGLTLSKLGLFDEVPNPDHERSQWLGCMIDAIIVAEAGRLHGFRYPSRKHRGHDAIALSSRHVDSLAAQLTVAHAPFAETDAWQALARDPCRVAPPAR